MTLNNEQIRSFNRFITSFINSNKYISKAVSRSDKIIVFTTDNQLVFDLNELDEAYQMKFIINNMELYCTSLFIALKPIIITFLKNEGMIGYNFHCVYLLDNRRVDKKESVSFIR